MRRGRRIWIVYAAICLVVLAALLQVSRVLIDAAFEKRRAEEAGRHQAKERAALWQLDFAIAPLVSYETGRAIAIEIGAVAPDPAGEAFVRARFARADGRILEAAASLEFAPELLDLPPDPTALLAENPSLVAPDEAWFLNGASIPSELNLAQNDLPSRQLQNSRSNALNPMQNFAAALGEASLEPFRAVWVARRDGGAEELVLFRRGARGVEQFVVLDRAALERWLREEVAEILPDLRLRPQREPAAAGQSVLATLPYRLESAPPKGEAALDDSFVTTLGIAWGAVLLALATTGFVLRATQSLSERRARFVSTVTHELRTPLTTFRMYAQMLASGMVTDEDRRRAYLGTLEEESARLSRVVESVLLYARLEEGAAAARREETTLAELADRLLVPLGRATQAQGLELDFEFEGPEDAVLRVDAQSLEQILVNLADNAAKYGRGAEPRLSVALRLGEKELEILVGDRGEGIPERERKSVFEPFRRRQEHAAGHAPGIGLGLALARGLARAQGGDLELVPAAVGARFRLRLPRA